MPYCATAESTDAFLKSVLNEILNYLKDLVPKKHTSQQKMSIIFESPEFWKKTPMSLIRGSRKILEIHVNFLTFSTTALWELERYSKSWQVVERGIRTPTTDRKKY